MPEFPFTNVYNDHATNSPLPSLDQIVRCYWKLILHTPRTHSVRGLSIIGCTAAPLQRRAQRPNYGNDVIRVPDEAGKKIERQ